MLNKWRRGSLFFKLLSAHLFIVLITLIAVNIFLSYLAEEYFFSAREWELTSQAEKVAGALEEEILDGNREEIEKVARALALSLDVKIRVIDPALGPDLGKGEVIIAAPRESEEETQLGLEESEIKYVLQGNSFSKKAFGPEIQRLLVAIPVITQDSDSNPENVISVITVSAPLTGVEATVAQISRMTTYSGLFAAAVAGILALSLAKTISNPLQVMTRAARELLHGNFSSRINLKTTGEMADLTATFNQAVEENEKTVQEQKRLQSLQQNLVANVSHEFRAPLTSIQGFAEAILDGHVKEEEQERCLQIVLDNTHYLNRLVDELLELSSIESGDIQLKMDYISPLQLAKRVVGSNQPKFQDKQILMENKVNEELPAIWGDEDRLFQILNNLMENAIHYTPPGGIIRLDASNENGLLIFLVQDTGTGIPPEDIQHIWDRFYKVDKSRNRAHRGKGLGLCIVKELVNLHNGQVSVESTPGEGSTFYVSLPTAEQPGTTKDNDQG